MIIPNIWENKKWQPNHQPDWQCFWKTTLSMIISTMINDGMIWDDGISPLSPQVKMWFMSQSNTISGVGINRPISESQQEAPWTWISRGTSKNMNMGHTGIPVHPQNGTLNVVWTWTHIIWNVCCFCSEGEAHVNLPQIIETCIHDMVVKHKSTAFYSIVDYPSALLASACLSRSMRLENLRMPSDVNDMPILITIFNNWQQICCCFCYRPWSM